jgi:PPOX class probable F420-dependent enzyme
MAATRVTWQSVVARLENERDYWLSTVASDGSPHVTPVWAAFVADDCYLYSERRTVKARNIAADPRVVLHLGDATDVVIVHGHLDDVGHPRDHDQVLITFASKYRLPDDQAFLPTHDPDFDVLYLLRPTRALMWKLADYDASQSRWAASSGRPATGPRGWRFSGEAL